MYKSPLHYCRIREVWVALDMSVAQCRAINACPVRCPYKALFAAVDDERKQLALRCKAPPLERQAAG